MPEEDLERVQGYVEAFHTWLNVKENQFDFFSLQKAYELWLYEDGYRLFGDSYTQAVQVILVYLSRCIANPMCRRYRTSSDPVEHTVLQVRTPEVFEWRWRTYWEFFTEEQFHKGYREWLEDQDST